MKSYRQTASFSASDSTPMTISKLNAELQSLSRVDRSSAYRHGAVLSEDASKGELADYLNRHFTSIDRARGIAGGQASGSSVTFSESDDAQAMAEKLNRKFKSLERT